MPEQDITKELALSRTRSALRESPSFHNLGAMEQRNLFKDVFKQEYRNLQQGNGVAETSPTGPLAPGAAEALARRQRRAGTPERAGDLIDDERHLNKRIEQAGELAGEFVDEVDFPGFVRDLLKAVFDANLEVTLAQMTSYQQLLQTATASISKFVNAIDDTAAFGYLAENQGDDFNIDFGDDTDNEGNPQAILTDKDGNPIASAGQDIGDNQIKAKIMEAKIAMAKEQRALLRETILMGITRLVVEKGNVKASVLFDIKATEKIDKKDKAALKESISSGSSFSASGGLVGKIFGGPKGGHTRSRRKTKISVSSAKSEATTDLAAKLAGSVDITFKSDYFELNRFADMYGPVTEADKAEAAAGAKA